MSPRGRGIAAVACIVLVLAGTFIPAMAVDLGTAVLVPLYLVVPLVLITLVRRAAFRCAIQPLALASTPWFRAPPAA